MLKVFQFKTSLARLPFEKASQEKTYLQCKSGSDNVNINLQERSEFLFDKIIQDVFIVIDGSG